MARWRTFLVNLAYLVLAEGQLQHHLVPPTSVQNIHIQHGNHQHDSANLLLSAQLGRPSQTQAILLSNQPSRQYRLLQSAGLQTLQSSQQPLSQQTQVTPAQASADDVKNHALFYRSANQQTNKYHRDSRKVEIPGNKTVEEILQWLQTHYKAVNLRKGSTNKNTTKFASKTTKTANKTVDVAVKLISADEAPITKPSVVESLKSATKRFASALLTIGNFQAREDLSRTYLPADFSSTQEPRPFQTQKYSPQPTTPVSLFGGSNPQRQPTTPRPSSGFLQSTNQQQVKPGNGYQQPTNQQQGYNKPQQGTPPRGYQQPFQPQQPIYGGQGNQGFQPQPGYQSTQPQQGYQQPNQPVYQPNQQGYQQPSQQGYQSQQPQPGYSTQQGYQPPTSQTYQPAGGQGYQSTNQGYQSTNQGPQSTPGYQTTGNQGYQSTPQGYQPSTRPTYSSPASSPRPSYSSTYSSTSFSPSGTTIGGYQSTNAVSSTGSPTTYGPSSSSDGFSKPSTNYGDSSGYPEPINTVQPPFSDEQNGNQIYSGVYPNQGGSSPSSGGTQRPVTTYQPNDIGGNQQVGQHPPHIHEIDVQCSKESMTVNLEFNEQFNGVIYSKGHHNDDECRYVQPNSGSTKYSFTLKLNSCGTQYIEDFASGQPAYLENTLVIQNEPGILEIWDYIRNVKCLWEGSITQSLSTGLSIDGLNQEVVTFSGDTAKAKLELQAGRGPFSYENVNLVRIGDLMTLVITVEGDNGFNIRVGECIASDGQPNTANRISLTDDRGCTVKEKVMGAFQFTRNPTSGASVAYAFFRAFKFPDVMELAIECSVQLCKTECAPCPDPNQLIEPRRRRRWIQPNATADEVVEELRLRNRIQVFLPEELPVQDRALASRDNQICITPYVFYSTTTLLLFLTSVSTLAWMYFWAHSSKG
ncbi:Hypothetical protein NTJ_15707 [Nesidiocoris tenuis]|uniref:ZP domain-containing protein n=1 Tax=Nesidiocoris tenuis TaxID=355587 RepID=A0ABN7BF04_9HEMI|nr:Hypothetical protein NTJ_15707 [Nesidiocoris tenuis]